jgi:hypothetical protein
MVTGKTLRVLAAALGFAGAAFGSLQLAAQQLPTVQPRPGELLQGMPPPLTAQQSQTARAAAATALLRFGPTVAAGDYRSLGFASPAELKTATVGTPVQLVFVPLDKLVAYRKGQEGSALLQSGGGLIVPVLVGTGVRCAVFLNSAASGYTGVGLGSPHMTRLVTESIAAAAKSHHVAPQTLVIVKIPALFLTFIARFAGTEIWLTPVASAPRWDLHAGQEVTADNVFARLQDAARDYHASNLSGGVRR